MSYIVNPLYTFGESVVVVSLVVSLLMLIVVTAIVASGVDPREYNLDLSVYGVSYDSLRENVKLLNESMNKIYGITKISSSDWGSIGESLSGLATFISALTTFAVDFIRIAVIFFIGLGLMISNYIPQQLDFLKPVVLTTSLIVQLSVYYYLGIQLYNIIAPYIPRFRGF